VEPRTARIGELSPRRLCRWRRSARPKGAVRLSSLHRNRYWACCLAS